LAALPALHDAGAQAWKRDGGETARQAEEK
jgi:hypothetical protein